MRRVAWLGLWPAGIAIGLAAEYFSIRADNPENPWQDLAVGWAFIAAGLIAMARRPKNRIAWLMTAVGFSWFIGNFQMTNVPVLFSLGAALEPLASIFLAHLMLAYPQGDPGRVGRVLVVAIYVWNAIAAPVIALTYDPRNFFDCAACPHGGLAVFPSQAVYDGVYAVGKLLTGPFSLAVLAVLVGRFVTATPAMRRALSPLWVASILIVVSFISAAAAGEGTPHTPHDSLPEILQRVAQLLVPVAFLFGLFRSRFAQAGVADLLRSLAKPLPPGQLRQALAQTLGDPSVDIGFWLPASDSYVDEEGHRIEVPTALDPRAPRAVTRVEADGRPLAVLVHDRALLEEPELVNAAGTAARLALENERLQAEVKAQLEEVRASRARIVTAADEERRRVERNLHDGAQQRLITLSLALRMAQEQAAGQRNGALAATLTEAAEEARLALSEVRELARGLHPTLLTEAGLGPALESLAERSAVPIRISGAPAERFSPQVEATA